MTGLEPGQMENYPAGEAVRYYIRDHELGHVLQNNPASPGQLPFHERFVWALRTENDADAFAFDSEEAGAEHSQTSPALADGLRKVIPAVRHARALQGFLNAIPDYWVSLTLDSRARGLAPPSPERCRLAGYELRWRVYTKMLTGENIAADSLQVQGYLNDWLHGRLDDRNLHYRLDCAFNSLPFHWKDHNNIQHSLPVLREIAETNEITDRWTARNARLVIEAAHYFCPSLTLAPRIDLREELGIGARTWQQAGLVEAHAA
jgi:hypothetical protein